MIRFLLVVPAVTKDLSYLQNVIWSFGRKSFNGGNAMTRGSRATQFKLNGGMTHE